MRGNIIFACAKPGREPGELRPAEMDNYYVLFYTLCLDAIKVLKADIPFVVNFENNSIRVVRRQAVYNAIKWLSQEWPFDVKQTYPLVESLVAARKSVVARVKSDFRELSQQKFSKKYKLKTNVSRDLVVLMLSDDHYFSVPQSFEKEQVIYKSKGSRKHVQRIRKTKKVRVTTVD